MQFIVYAIVDPRDEEIFYIGRTSELRRRKREHGRRSPAGVRIAELRSNGLAPIFVVLERCPSLEASMRAEILWMEMLHARGARLVNGQFCEQTADSALKRLEYLSNGRAPRHGLRWSVREMTRLRRLQSQGCSPGAMAGALGRSVRAVLSRLQILDSPQNKPSISDVDKIEEARKTDAIVRSSF